jgi:hypothetical protein
MDIRNLELQFRNAAISKSVREKDVFRDSWEETKSTFADVNKTDMVLNM